MSHCVKSIITCWLFVLFHVTEWFQSGGNTPNRHRPLRVSGLCVIWSKLGHIHDSAADWHPIQIIRWNSKCKRSLHDGFKERIVLPNLEKRKAWNGAQTDLPASPKKWAALHLRFKLWCQMQEQYPTGKVSYTVHCMRTGVSNAPIPHVNRTIPSSWCWLQQLYRHPYQTPLLWTLKILPGIIWPSGFLRTRNLRRFFGPFSSSCGKRAPCETSAKSGSQNHLKSSREDGKLWATIISLFHSSFWFSELWQQS